jgi:hypothetical protein
MRSQGLSAEQAAKLSTELAATLARGGDYERAEWAFVTAHMLAARARHERLAELTPVRVPLALLPRLFAYLARVSEAHDVATNLGVHVLGFGVLDPSFRPEDSALWTAETDGAGRAGVVLAAATWDDEQLTKQGEVLSARFADGPIELVIGLDPIAPTAPGKNRALVHLAGHVEGEQLLLERAGRSLQHARWPLIERYLAAPLALMHGAQFPPDELIVVTPDAGAAQVALRAAREDAITECTLDGLAVHCRGPLDDMHAASRALVRVARTALVLEGRALWAGAE